MRIQIKSKFLKLLTVSFLMICTNYSYAACSINSVQFSFGGYSPLSSSDKTSSANIGISCTKSTSVTVKLRAGNSGNFMSRYLLKGTDKLYYNVFSDVGMTRIFGDGTSGTFQYSGVVSTSPTSIPIYGKIPANQQIPIGAYTDALTVELVF